ncbi:MAG: hypothetical protein Q7U72_12480 [Brevundimonas sp.]|uniref:hypothetical protein n=1 Tax=Brevundimonas sp. TaxID=1871086 RepID=UPI0027237004|nr:hypothetical protein [Brevundimonas sp.]MDO9078247.1 hypothetical protein [Brevundimonas sp.]MDP3081319.1 hypothetical protein [Brevundimonas sp.]MDZ4060865.1 hypothetical protein [Brevundimonas sp.]
MVEHGRCFGKVEFLLTATVKGIHFQPARPDGIEFAMGGAQDVCLQLSPASPDDPFGSRLGLTCRVTAAYDAASDSIAFISSFIDGRFLPFGERQIELPFIRQGKELISAEGEVSRGYIPRLNFCPSDVQELAATAEADLHGSLSRFLGLVRWRQNSDATHNLIEYSSLYWRVADGLYHAVPHRSGGRRRVPTMVGVHWGEEREQELRQLWDAPEVYEPLAHELLREASTVSQTSPRSALLIAATAAESGVKSHLARVAPDTAWLLEEMQSPPIYKILRDYIPALHSAKGRDMGFWSDVTPRLKQVGKLFEVRNKVAHTGRAVPSDISLSDAVELVSDLLYLLDVLEGHEWAKQRVSGALRQRLGWPSPPETRLVLEMYDPRD